MHICGTIEARPPLQVHFLEWALVEGFQAIYLHQVSTKISL
jgi:hypothetical protein